MKYSSKNKLCISLDDSVSGTIYMSDGKQIEFSTDYGKTFHDTVQLISAVTGLYKKPDSDKLYATTQSDIYEITPSSIRSIKHLMVSVNDEKNNIPKNFILYQNYPNPFNPTTTIEYQIPKSEYVTLKIYDVLGREVKTLINHEYKNVGSYKINFNGSNLSSSVYFYRIRAGNFVSTRKMLFIK